MGPLESVFRFIKIFKGRMFILIEFTVTNLHQGFSDLESVLPPRSYFIFEDFVTRGLCDLALTGFHQRACIKFRICHSIPFRQAGCNGQTKNLSGCLELWTETTDADARRS